MRRVALVLLAAACTAEVPTETDVDEAERCEYADIAGAWDGDTFAGATRYETTLEIYASVAEDERLGLISFVGGTSCNEELICKPARQEGDTYVAAEVVLPDSDGGCVDGTARLTLESDDALHYEWLDGGVGEPVVVGTLSRSDQAR